MGYKQYCKNYQDIKNYEKAKADNFKNWQCHHILETHTSDGERRLVDITAAELIALGMYYNRPSSELIFLTIKEHNALHHKGKHLPEETRKKLSEVNKGKKMSEESRRKNSESHKGNSYRLGKHHSEETRRKLREANKGMRFFNNGKINTMAKECPDGFVPGRLKRR